jgi:uncharacterized protein (DUF2267 family)
VVVVDRIIEDRLEQSMGLDRESAAHAARVVLSVLSEQLPPAERAELLRVRPPPLAEALPREAPVQHDGLEQFYERVARRMPTELGRAVELAQVACAALAERLDGDSLQRLRSRLPGGLAALLAASRGAPRAPVAAHGERRYPTLADGRPGSHHPLSEAQADRAQQDSVARSDEPHADAKLSSSAGATQEREGETLASGKPGSSRPIGREKA